MVATSRIILENSKRAVYLLTNDGSAESNAVKVDVSALSGLDGSTNVLRSATIVAGGTGYSVGDILTVIPGAGGVVVRASLLNVSAVDGSGVITNFTIQDKGDYTTVPDDVATNAVTDTGVGAGATFALVYTLGQSVSIRKIDYTVGGSETSVQLKWDATTDDTMLILSGSGVFTFYDGGQVLSSPFSVGATGDIILSTAGAAVWAAGDSYTIILEVYKESGYTHA